MCRSCQPRQPPALPVSSERDHVRRETGRNGHGIARSGEAGAGSRCAWRRLRQDAGMDAVRVALLREVLAGTEWLQATRRFAAALRAVRRAARRRAAAGRHRRRTSPGTWPPISTTRPPGRGCRSCPRPWCATGSRTPAPAHLAVGLGRLEAAGRGETLLVVAPEPPGAALLERVHDARRAGATVLALDGGSPASAPSCSARPRRAGRRPRRARPGHRAAPGQRGRRGEPGRPAGRTAGCRGRSGSRPAGTGGASATGSPASPTS